MKWSYESILQSILKGDISVEKLKQALEKIKSGELKPKLLPADIPPFRSVVKQKYDSRLAIELFNKVYDFILAAKIKYFKKEEYEEYRKKFGTKLESIEHYRL